MRRPGGLVEVVQKRVLDLLEDPGSLEAFRQEIDETGLADTDGPSTAMNLKFIRPQPMEPRIIP